MDNNTLLFQDKGSGRFKDVKIYPNRIEVLKKGAFGGKHTETANRVIADAEYMRRTYLSTTRQPCRQKNSI